MAVAVTVAERWVAGRAPVLAVASGDPAGIGPEICVRAAASANEHVLLFGDASQFEKIAERVGVDARSWVSADARDVNAGAARVTLVNVGSLDAKTCDARGPSPEGGAFQLRVLEAATRAVQSGAAHALVTGPVSKASVALVAPKFTGQTEWLAQHVHLLDDDVTMMFLGPALRVSLVTTHMALADVPRAVTAKRIVRAGVHLAEALVRMQLANPRVVIAGLNPHAGEGGLFGDEEIRVFEPALLELGKSAPFQTGAVKLLGVRPSEAVYREAVKDPSMGVVAPYHDQATIVSKLVDWGRAVNVTWGLPFIRTSVDHGVAYDLAGTGKANPDGMLAAMDLAARLARSRA